MNRELLEPEVTSSFGKLFKKLNPATKNIVMEAIKNVTKNPHSGKPIKSTRNCFAVRFKTNSGQSSRILYSLESRKNFPCFVKLGPRCKDSYKNLSAKEFVNAPKFPLSSLRNDS